MFIIKIGNHGDGIIVLGVAETIQAAQAAVRRHVIDSVEGFNRDMVRDQEASMFIATTIEPQLESNVKRLTKYMGSQSFGDIVGTVWFVGADHEDLDSGDLLWIEPVEVLK